MNSLVLSALTTLFGKEFQSSMHWALKGLVFRQAALKFLLVLANRASENDTCKNIIAPDDWMALFLSPAIKFYIFLYLLEYLVRLLENLTCSLNLM